MFPEAKDIEAFRGRFTGRCFILGAGPSLRLELPLLPRLYHEFTFGVNYLLQWDDLPFYPTFYCAQETNNLEAIDALLNREKYQGPRFFATPQPEDIRRDYPKWIPVLVDRHLDMQRENGPFAGLDDELTPLAWNNGSTVMSAVQIACWLGFWRVYLLGCDAGETGHCYPEEKMVPRGRQDGFMRAAMNAEVAMGRMGRKLVDLSQGGGLPIGKGKLEEVLGSGY